MDIILASQSPRRRELMGFLPYPYIVRVSQADERMDDRCLPQDEVARISRNKAYGVERNADDIVIGADTIVVCNGEILGKPRDAADAYRMLRLLSGRDHQVMTGMTLLRGSASRTVTEVTDIHFRELSDREIARYVASGEPMDKAGSYGIQGGAALFCERMVGDYYNVMGLPVCRLGQVLKGIAPEIFD